MSFLLSFFSFFTILSVRVDWINDFLDIPLFSQIDDYKELPEAQLFIGNIQVDDPLMYYERDGVDHTFFSVVTTNYIRTFTIRYRVTFPTYQIVQTQDIVFNIVDLISPTIIQLPIFRIPLGERMPDLFEGIIISDNYDDSEYLNVSVNSFEVILNQVGTYDIFYQISDSSGNISQGVSSLEIYDYLAPVIVQKEALILPFGKSFEWQDYFDISDNDDPFPDVVVDTTHVDFQKLGTYVVLLTAIDKNLLSTERFYSLIIVDDESPSIIVKSQPPPIPVFTSPSEIDFYDYILSVSDNYDEVSILDVQFWFDIEFNVLGVYDVYYHIEDLSGNCFDLKMKISVIDDEKPTIHLISPLIFDVFDAEPFYIDYVEYGDNYDDFEDLIFKMSESVKMDKVGKYPIIFEVTDESGNKAFLGTYVEIVDCIPPMINQLNDIIITDFMAKDVTYYFEANDNYDGVNQISIEIDDTLVDYENIGIYTLWVYAYDLSNNIRELETTIIVIDIIEPEFTLKQSLLTLEIFSQPVNLTSYISDISDNYDMLSVDDMTINGDIDYESLGVYVISYELQDYSMNRTEKKLYITIDDRTPPSVEMTQMTLYTGEYFDPLIGITTFDNLNQIEIHVFPEILDTSHPGKKEVTYVISDERGNYTTQVREVIITPREVTNEITDYLPVLMVTLIGIGACYYLYRKMT